MSTKVELAEDVALVLFELLSSGKLTGSVETAERNALWALEAALQKQLVAPFAADYAQQVSAAKQSLLTRYGT